MSEMFCVFGGFARMRRHRKSKFELLLWIFTDVEQADAAARGLVADPEMILKHGCPIAIRWWYQSEFQAQVPLTDEHQRLWDNQAFAQIAEALREVYVVRCVTGQPAELVERYDVEGWDGEVGGEA